MEQNYSKKIRILSFQNAHNFGAVLQAYGLQQTILSMGYTDVKFIYYNPKYLSDRYNPFVWLAHPIKWTIKTLLGRLIRFPFYFISTLRRNAAFDGSIKRLLNQTKSLVTKESDLINEEHDVLVCGSDQIWNSALTRTFDPVFFGQGPYKKKGWCCSYAPSTELSSLTDEKTKKMADMIRTFKYVSVRETHIKEQLEKYTNQMIDVCVDPTILCGVDAYNKIAAPRQVKKDYILVYAYNHQKQSIQDLIKSIPNWQKYDVYYVLLGTRGMKTFFNHKVLCEISIEKFLSYIKYASFVVTNSFHGLAFSLLFEKNFNVAYEPGKQTRCESLLNQINLSDRFVRKIGTESWISIDYLDINKRICKIKQHSLNFLENALTGK